MQGRSKRVLDNSRADVFGTAFLPFDRSASHASGDKSHGGTRFDVFSAAIERNWSTRCLQERRRFPPRNDAPIVCEPEHVGVDNESVPSVDIRQWLRFDVLCKCNHPKWVRNSMLLCHLV